MEQLKSSHSERTSQEVDKLDHTGTGGDRQTALVRRRYDRLAKIYDVTQWPMERRADCWRRDLWDRVEGEQILEVGAGTGANVPYYGEHREMTVTDISAKMLEQARVRAAEEGVEATFEIADVQALPYPDDHFDAAVATFVFCSVPDPVQGLRELRRVVVDGGSVHLLEHVLTETPVLRFLMKILDPLTVRLWGAHISRETVDNVRRAGYSEVSDTDLSMDIVKRIEARG